MPDGILSGRVALVTGASRGIGRAAAVILARAGAQIVAVARTQAGLEELDDEIRAIGGTAALAPLDLTDFTKIDEMAFAIARRFGRLDILIGNAGMLGGLYPMGQMPPAMFEQVFALNVTANWRLLRAFDAPLRVAEAARLIFLTTRVGREPTAYWGAYAASKAALDNLVLTYAAEIETTKMRVNLFDPGIVATKLRATAFPGENPQSIAGADNIAPGLLALASPDCPHHGKIVGIDGTVLSPIKPRGNS